MYWVYILTNQTRTTLYIGVTGHLAARIAQHKAYKVAGFTSKYRVNRLVYVEEANNVYDAMNREKQLKKFRRSKKVALIETINPNWEEISVL